MWKLFAISALLVAGGCATNGTPDVSERPDAPIDRGIESPPRPDLQRAGDATPIDDD